MAVAAYARIAADLREKIESRDIGPGAQLPSELDLRSKYQASRNTVLDAIKMLRDEGLVETRPGLGWFATIRIVPFVNPIEWGDEAAIRAANDRGRRPRVASPTISSQPAPPNMAERLGVAVGTDMIVRRQDWFLDDLPWKQQAVWCPTARADEGADLLLVAKDIVEGVGNYLYRALDLHPAGASFYFLPREPTIDEMRFFGFTAESGIPYVIELVRTASVVGNRGPSPLYAAVGVYAGDRNRFESFRAAPPLE